MLNMEWHLTYDLASNLEWIQTVQDATLTSDDFGIEPNPALFGSPEWWSAVQDGSIETSEIEGTISEVYWGSMADWPEFELTDSLGKKSRWTREGDVTRYVPGLGARLETVYIRHRGPRAELEGEVPMPIRIWVESSRLRSSTIAPGPGGVGFRNLTVLFRPVGEYELRLIEQLDHRAFPPRLPEQPIFYPVLSEHYATRIAREWNTKDSNSGKVGYVTRFHVDEDFLSRYEVHEAGGRDLLEYWIPAEELEEFNRHIRGRIEVVAEYREA